MQDRGGALDHRELEFAILAYLKEKDGKGKGQASPQDEAAAAIDDLLFNMLNAEEKVWAAMPGQARPWRVAGHGGVQAMEGCRPGRGSQASVIHASAMSYMDLRGRRRGRRERRRRARPTKQETQSED